MKKKVSAIISIFNEEKTLKKVISTLLNNSLVDEIICVNDSSSDDSLKILKSFDKQIILINLEKNKGKGHAMSVGIKKATHKIIMFADADLKNLDNTHINSLLKPILSNKAQVSIGFYTRSLEDILFSFFYSGQRVYFKKDLEPLLKPMKESRFGVEILLNHYLKKLKHKRVFLKGLKVTSKQAKHGFFIGTWEFTKQVGEMVSQMVRLRG